MVYVFLADGCEEIEALCPVDVLRRAGFDTKTVGVTGNTVTGSHNIEIKADIAISDAAFDNLEGVILPGGMPGTLNLEKDETVQKFIDFADKNNLLIGAICAAPSILGHKGILRDKKAVCFPGFEDDLIGANVLNLPAVADGNIVTGKGAGAAFEFSFKVLEVLTGDKQKAQALAKNMEFRG